jgi:hypothetical protein
MVSVYGGKAPEGLEEPQDQIGEDSECDLIRGITVFSSIGPVKSGISNEADLVMTSIGKVAHSTHFPEKGGWFIRAFAAVLAGY